MTDLSVRQFMGEAREALASGATLSDSQRYIGERLSVLARQDGLTRIAQQLGPGDASTGNYLLWREPPHFSLVMIQLDVGFRSPVHEHGTHWVMGAVHRGIDRWDVFTRRDDGARPGEADLELLESRYLEPGAWTVLPEPPSSIHSHNNVTNEPVYELIFSASEPLPAGGRLLYDVEGHRAFPSWFDPAAHVAGDYFPPRIAGPK